MGLFEAQTPQQGGQFCVNQTVLLEGVFKTNKPLWENPSEKHPPRGQIGSRKFDLPVEALGPKNGQKHFPLYLGGFPAY